MDRSLVDILACPVCKSSLELTVEEEHDGSVVTGALRCPQCNVSYPIENGIPNMLPRTSSSKRAP
jgi:uncharacterized protein YbaR (Trm112 family)